MGDVLVKIKESDLALIASLGIAYVVFAPKAEAKSNWILPLEADPYLHTINSATRENKLPPKLLARVLYQESRFRPDIINGQTKSSAGAVGIAQIVPRWHPDVDPTNPHDSINYAAKYLKKLKGSFGNWRDALAAYNWGQGNLRRYKSGSIKYMPTETKNYVSQITRDVNV